MGENNHNRPNIAGITIFVVRWGYPKRIGNKSDEFDNWFYLNISKVDTSMVCGQNKLSFDKIVSCNNLISFPSVEHFKFNLFKLFDGWGAAMTENTVEHKLRVILTADVKDSETESVSGIATYCGKEISN